MKSALLIIVAALAILSPLAGHTAGAAPAVPARYFPTTGDHIDYTETVTVTNGVGDYQGYTEASFINGSIAVTGLGSPSTDVDSSYAYTTSYRNNSGGSEHFSSTGQFTWSAQTFRYLQGTDNQSPSYTNPYVWFYVDNTQPDGATFFLLNSQFSMVSTSAAYPTARSTTGYAAALYAFSNGSYQRSDSYGTFVANYAWKTYFDPTTGFILGYTDNEHDANSTSGFDYTDILTVTAASYTVTPTAAPSSGSPSFAFTSTIVVILLALVVVVIIVVILYAVMRSRRGPTLPQHSAGGTVAYSYNAPPPAGPPPPPLHLTPQDQPSVQQVVVREKVMVNCRYCGALMEPEAANCPKCGAPRA